MADRARILAIETAGRIGSVCVAEGATVLARAELPSDRRHAAGLHTAIDHLVRRAGWPPDGIDEVYVSSGPGSFTGVRIGITVARTLAWAIGARLVRVPTLNGLARNALDAGPPPFVATVLDAKRNQIFSAFFAFEAAHRRYAARIDAVMIDPAEFLARAADLAGGIEQVAVLGEGLVQHRDAVAHSGARILPESTWAGRAESVHGEGRAMALRGEYCAAGDCVPIYVRLPEPEEKWQAQQAAARKDSTP
jgi:tRNA threonylcarbamoyladenosine biosynthesis protein TsaB